MSSRVQEITLRAIKMLLRLKVTNLVIQIAITNMVIAELTKVIMTKNLTWFWTISQIDKVQVPRDQPMPDQQMIKTSILKELTTSPKDKYQASRDQKMLD